MDFIKRELIQFFDRMMELVREECQLQARLDAIWRADIPLKEDAVNGA